MLTPQERRSVLRALTIAYYTYRDLSYRELCKKERIWLKKQPHGGEYGYLGESSSGKTEMEFSLVSHYRDKKLWKKARKLEKYLSMRSRFVHMVTIPAKDGALAKEKIFWHEIGHLVVHGFFSSFVGYDAQLAEFTNHHWEHERLADAFGCAVMLHRYGIGPVLSPHDESFFFADEKSMCYEQVRRFQALRILMHCDQARQKGANVDLTPLEELARLLKQWGENGWGMQPDLPMNYQDTHVGRPGLKDVRVPKIGDHEEYYILLSSNQDKMGWTEISPREGRLISWMRKLAEAHLQLSLFDETTAADKEDFERSFKRLDAAVRRYQKS